MPAADNQSEGSKEQDLRIVIETAAQAWDASLARHREGSAQMSWGWSRYKARIGHVMRPLRVIDAHGTTLAMALVATRRRAGLRLSHVAAGPLLFTSSEGLGLRVVSSLVAELTRRPADVAVFEPLLFGTELTTRLMLRAGLVPALSPRQFTLVSDLSGGIGAVESAMDRRWRRVARPNRSEPGVVTEIVTGNDARADAIDALIRFYEAMVERKGLSGAFVPAAARDVFIEDPRYAIIRVRRNDETMSVLVCHTTQTTMTAFFIASAPESKAVSGDSLAYLAALRQACAMGLKLFDAGGVDPAGHVGGYMFKSGLGGSLVQTGPLWIASRPHWLARLLAPVLGHMR
jgi:CelD/BcsL family acetyltransferase involved in cellulose biosynthesis